MRAKELKFSTARVDLVIKVFALVCILIPILVMVSIIWEMLVKGMEGFSLDFMMGIPERSGREGGILPILVSTFFVVFLALAWVLPPALGCALFLSDFQKTSRYLTRVRNVVSVALDGLTAVPSIVFGVVGNAIFCRFFGFGYSILAGSLTLGFMIWPYMTRAFEETFSSVSKDIYFQSLSLGLSSYSYFRNVILAPCLPGIVLGIILAMSRALAETSALLFTSGYSDRLPESLFDSGRVLSVHILDLAMNVTGGDQNSYASGLVLVIFLLVLNSVFSGAFVLYKRFLK